MGRRNAGVASSRVLVGYVAVDSGRILVCDPAYLSSQQIKQRVDNAASMSGEPLQLALAFLAGQEGCAVVVSSGMGDGVYPVYAKIAEVAGFGKRVMKLEVDFS